MRQPVAAAGSPSSREGARDALGGMVWHPRQHVSEPRLRVDVVESRSLDQAASAPAAFVRAGEGSSCGAQLQWSGCPGWRHLDMQMRSSSRKRVSATPGVRE